MRSFLWFRFLHGAWRPSSSAQLHLFYLFGLFVHDVHDHRRKFPLYVFCDLGLYCGVCFGTMGAYTARRNDRNLRDSTETLYVLVYTSNLSTHEIREVSVISAPRTLETDVDCIVSVI